MAKPEETRARVAHIVGMMQQGQWKGRSSVYDLASLWEVSVSRIEQLAAEAKRNGGHQDGKAVGGGTQ